MSVGAGWSDLVLGLRRELAALGITEVSVCEKYGTLRASYTPPSHTIAAAVEIETRYERASEIVCEACGEPGQVRVDRRRTKTLCAGHAGTETVPPHVVPEPERVILRAPHAIQIRQQMLDLLADGFEMVRMVKPVMEGNGTDVVAWFERPKQED